MKRSELRRKTALTAKSELKRTVALGRSPLARSSLHAGSAARKAAPKGRTSSPIPAKVRAALKLRSGGLCEIQAPGCVEFATDFSHRKKVGAGGRKGAAAAAHHVLSNALAACRPCHAFGHRNPAVAYAAGWMLREHQDPIAEPVVYRGDWCRLDNQGSVSPTDPTEEVTMAKFDNVTYGTFRKSATTEARRWDPANPEDVTGWLTDAGAHFKVFDDGRLGIGTLESGEGLDRHAAKPGDWVLQGQAGEFYAHDAALFAQNYEQVA